MTQKGKTKEIAKFGSEDAYRADMRRRRALVRNPGMALKGNSERARELANKRWGNKNAEKEDPGPAS